MNSMVLERRRDASSIVLNETTIWVTGGHASQNQDYIFEYLSDRFPTAKNTTEFIKYDEPSVKGPELPFKIFGHTMVKVDSETVYIIGGFSKRGHWVEECDRTWVVDLSNFDIKPGPSLNEGRSEHSSSTMKINGKLFIVVAGGRTDNEYGFQLNSVELLDTEFPQKGWIMGKQESILCSAWLTTESKCFDQIIYIFIDFRTQTSSTEPLWFNDGSFSNQEGSCGYWRNDKYIGV